MKINKKEEIKNLKSLLEFTGYKQSKDLGKTILYKKERLGGFIIPNNTELSDFDYLMEKIYDRLAENYLIITNKAYDKEFLTSIIKSVILNIEVLDNIDYKDEEVEKLIDILNLIYEGSYFPLDLNSFILDTSIDKEIRKVDTNKIKLNSLYKKYFAENKVKEIEYIISKSLEDTDLEEYSSFIGKYIIRNNFFVLY